MKNPLSTRRNLLAGAVALPLLPVSAFAMPADDPVIAPFREWQGILRALERACEAYSLLERQGGAVREEANAYETEVVIPTIERLQAAEERISHIAPTTLAGLVAQLTITQRWVGLVDVAYVKCAEDRLPYSMLAGAERMLAEGVS